MDTFDLDFAVSQCNADPARARSLLRRFADRLAGDVQAIEDAGTRGEEAELSHLAHRIKGSAAALAVHQVRELAARIEALAKQGDLPGVRALQPGLRDAASDFAREVEALIASADR